MRRVQGSKCVLLPLLTSLYQTPVTIPGAQLPSRVRTNTRSRYAQSPCQGHRNKRGGIKLTILCATHRGQVSIYGSGDARCETHIEGRREGPCSSCCGPRRGRCNSLQIASTSIDILLTIVVIHTELSAADRPARREVREVGGTLGAIEYCCKEAIVECGERALGVGLLICRIAAAHIIKHLSQLRREDNSASHLAVLYLAGPVAPRCEESQGKATRLASVLPMSTH